MYSIGSGQCAYTEQLHDVALFSDTCGHDVLSYTLYTFNSMNGILVTVKNGV